MSIKHFCDVCGREIESRYKIIIGVFSGDEKYVVNIDMEICLKCECKVRDVLRKHDEATK